MSVNKFLKKLKSYQQANVFNPYVDKCDIYDRFNAPQIRSQNLRKVLKMATTLDLDSLWVGRDLGYRGGRRTGLALIDENHMLEASKRWGVLLQQATKGEMVPERTAKNIWQVLDQLEGNVFMWNVFPFHPYENLKPFSNRSHTASERDAGLILLQELINLLAPKDIVAIGNDAFSALSKLNIRQTIHKVRHPSYGGEMDFYRQMREIYGFAG